MSEILEPQSPSPRRSRRLPHELRIPTVRHSPPIGQVDADLGLLAELAGFWRGHGFNLVGRPDREGGANVYLELNQTDETIKIDPIATSIPNRGFAMNDIELFGLTYLQKISDAVTGGALHIEPGIWIRQPDITAPPETAPPGAQIVNRMGSIPHGNAILVEGIASRFTGPPTLASGAVPYNGSLFPSFNSTPFAVGAPIFAAGTSEFALPPRRRPPRRTASPNTRWPTPPPPPTPEPPSATSPPSRFRPRSTACPCRTSSTIPSGSFRPRSNTSVTKASPSRASRSTSRPRPP